MSSTPAGAKLTEGHRVAQARIGARLVAQMFTAWKLLDPENIDATVADWLAVAVPLVQAQRRTSAALAADYMTAFRAAELGLDVAPFPPVIAGPAPVEAVTTSLVVTGPVRIKQATARGEQVARAARSAQATSASSGMRHTLNGGRDTITATTQADHRALGWARAVSGSPCAFCALLASRGPVYKSDQTAHFAAHDHCSCATEPVYHRDADWPPGSKRYSEVYAEAKAADGDTDANFRRLIEAA